MNKLLSYILFSTLFLTGCFSETNDHIKKIDKAKNEFLCKDKGGVYRHYASYDSREKKYSAICQNGYKTPRKEMEEIVIADAKFYPKNLYPK